MKKTIEIYALVVCFFSLIWLAVTLGLFLNQVVRIAFPQLTTPISNYNNFANQATPNNSSATKNKADEQLRTMAWEVNYKMSLQQERRDALRNMIHEIISLLISALIFIPHWRLVCQEKLS